MKNKSLILLSGEEGTLPAGEAKALFKSYDPDSELEFPERRIIIVSSTADPFLISSRIAFARRVGILIDSPSDAASLVRGKKVRYRAYSLRGGHAGQPTPSIPESASVDLKSPDFEFSLVQGEREYLALTSPRVMSQSWSIRRPRKRPFFHPSAIFPKLSRAMVNLTGCKSGEVLLDPFCGTGSILLEASAIGVRVVGADVSSKMVSGSLSNMSGFGQEWDGVVRAEAAASPFTHADGIATDVPYGRASRTFGKDSKEIIGHAIQIASLSLKKGGRAVVMHASHQALPVLENLVEEERHDLYVHKLLTRRISVLRKR